MSINVNGVTLPDIPADVLAQYPYAAIYKQTTIVDIGEEYEGTYGEDSTTEIVVLICSKTAHGVATGANLGAEYDGSLTTLEFEPTAITCYEYSSESSVWNTATSNDSYMVMIVNGEKSSEPNELATSTITGELLWSNHDIYELVENDEGALIYGTEIYFPSSVVAEPRIEATRLVTTVTYEGWPETAPTISTNFIDETYPYGALFEDNSTWWIVVSTQPIVYKDSESYNFNTNGNYIVYLWVDTDELSMWVETDASILFPIESFYDFSLIWSNHDVLNGTDNSVYFSKTGDVKVTTEEKTISLPAVPTEWVETYPYCCIGEMTIYGTKYCYLTLSTNTCGYIPPSLIEINQSLGGIYIPPCNVVYMYDEATATWVYEGEYVRETVMYDGYAPQLYISGVFWWSNHDIYVLSEDEQEQPVPTDEVYFHGTGVIEPPEQMAVDRIFIVSSAANLRRLTSTTDKFTTDAMMESLSGFTIPDGKIMWIDDLVFGEYDSTTNVEIMTNDTEEIYVTPGISLNPHSGDHNIALSFPNATSMSGGAFRDANKLYSFSAPLLTSIVSNSFNGCASLTSVELPVVQTVGFTAFKNCIALTAIDLPLATTLDYGAFYECALLTSINLPKVTEIGGAAFSMCAALASITLPSVITIESQAFYYCSALKKIDLGVVESIGALAFGLGLSARTIIIRTTSGVCKLLDTDDTTEGYASQFSSSDSVYVPSALLTEYKANAAWIESGVTLFAIEDYPDICGA